VFKREGSVQPRLEIRSVHGHLQLVPGVPVKRERLRPVAELHVAPNSVVEFPESDVVLRIVVANGEPVAVWLDVEKDSGPPVGIARNGLEFHADGAPEKLSTPLSTATG